MTVIFTALVSIIAGWFGHSLAMRVRFKEKSIEHKVNVFDSLLGHWVRMRNFVYRHHPAVTGKTVPEEVGREFDQIYGSSQQTVGRSLLVCGDRSLNKRINELTERMYRTLWLEMELPAINASMEEFKDDTFQLVRGMRAEIESDTRLTLSDLTHMFRAGRSKIEP